jgi:N-acetylneuraminic acid mutarotase
MKREFIILLTSLMLIGLLGTASMSQEDGTWTQKTDMPTARCLAGSAVVDGKIYVIGGSDQAKATSSAVEEYDPATDTWRRRTDMPTPRRAHSAAAVDGVIYAIGGWNTAGREVSTVEAYDPAADTWTTKADMPTRRALSAIAVVEGIIYVIGGMFGETAQDNRPLSAVEAYDPATDTWTTKADMPTARYKHAACAIDGRIYVCGGFTKCGDEASRVATVEVYDPATDTWSHAPDMPHVRGGPTASAVAGKIYIIGGGDPPLHPAGDIVDVYDPGTDTWTTEADRCPDRVGETTAAVVDGKIYAIGGSLYPGTPVFSRVYEFDPGLPDSLSTVSPAGKLLETWGRIKKVR